MTDTPIPYEPALTTLLTLSESFWQAHSLLNEPGTGWAWAGHLVQPNPDADSDEDQLAALAERQISARAGKVQRLVELHPEHAADIEAVWEQWQTELRARCQPRRRGR